MRWISGVRTLTNARENMANITPPYKLKFYLYTNTAASLSNI